MDWSIFHAINAGVATRDWLEDPVSELSGTAVTVYGIAIIALWFAARPYGSTRWKLASASGLVAAAIALLTNQVISHGVGSTAPVHRGTRRLTHLLSSTLARPFVPE